MVLTSIMINKFFGDFNTNVPKQEPSYVSWYISKGYNRFNVLCSQHDLNTIVECGIINRHADNESDHQPISTTFKV